MITTYCNLLFIYAVQAIDPSVLKFFSTYKVVSVYYAPFLILIPLITGLIHFKALGKPMRTLFYYVVFTAIMNAANSIAMAHHQQSTTLFEIFTLVEFNFVSLFFLEIFKISWRKIIIAIMIAFSILCVVCFFFFTKSPLGSYTKTIETILILAYCIIYISTQNKLDIETSWSDSSLNWVNAAFLIYFATTLLMFATADYWIKAPITTFLVFEIFQDVILILEWVLFAVAFIKAKKEHGR
jgi:hypothetical protein